MLRPLLPSCDQAELQRCQGEITFVPIYCNGCRSIESLLSAKSILKIQDFNATLWWCLIYPSGKVRATQGHSGRINRLVGCSPSRCVLRYLWPVALTATITSTALPPVSTQNSHFPNSMPAMASPCVSFQRPPSGIVLPI